MSPKLSIVTVTYNCEDVLEKTIQGVIAQSYEHIEFIIIDGKSKDGTHKIIDQYRAHIDVLVVEQDRNNYDAMNKGFDHATGDFIWFLHAGDYIKSDDTVKRILKDYDGEGFIYGEVEILGADGKIRPWHKSTPLLKNLSWKSFMNGMVICHQAMFIHRDYWLKYNDELYRISGDLDWSIRTMKQKPLARKTELIWCTFSDGGLSDRNRREAWKERFAILKKHAGILATVKQHIIFVLQSFKTGSVKY